MFLWNSKIVRSKTDFDERVRSDMSDSHFIRMLDIKLFCKIGADIDWEKFVLVSKI
jgi:hypothetical protein